MTAKQTVSEALAEMLERNAFDCSEAEYALCATELRRLAAVVARLPHTADGVPVIGDGMTVYCPRGHAKLITPSDYHTYCCEGECWSDGCQSDSGSGTGYSFAKCFAKKASLPDDVREKLEELVKEDA